MKRILTITAWLLLVSFAFAGGIDNKQNLSTAYIGSLSRNASVVGADIAAFNPAGVAMQEKNGLLLEIDCQYIVKSYEHEYANDTKKQDEPSLLPSFFVTYKKKNWGLFGSFTINAGGGKVDYKDGNIVTYGINYGKFSGNLENDEISANSMYHTYTLGGSYALNDKLSFALGTRLVHAISEVKTSADNKLNSANDIDAEFEKKANGFGYVLGINYMPNEILNFALHYDSKVPLEFETDIKSSTNATGTTLLAGMNVKDGQKTDRDLPGLIGLGAEYKGIEKLNLNVSFTYYLEKYVDWDSYNTSNTSTGKEYNLADEVSNSYDLSFSGRYDINEKLKASLGYMYTYVGLEAKDYDLNAKMSPVLNCHSFSLGLGYDYNEKLSFGLGSLYSSYVEEKDEANNVEYDKTNIIMSFSLAYRM